MFRTEEMCELSLLVIRRDVEAVTEAIAKEGVFHQVDTSYLGREEDWEAEHWQDRIQDYQGIEQRILLMMGALEIPEEASPVEYELHIGADLAELREEIMAIEQSVLPLVNRLKEREERLMQLEAMLHRLQPMAELDIDLSSLQNLTFLHAEIGIVPTTNLDRLNASLLHIPHVILTLGTEGAGTFIALFGANKDAEILGKAAHSAYMSPISMPEEYRGTPKEILDSLNAEIASLRRERETCKQETTELRDKWDSRLRELLWRVRADLSLLRAVDRFGQVRDVYLVAGWVPKRRASQIIDTVSAITGGRVVADITSAEQSGDLRSVPTALGNKGPLQAFEGLVTNYAWPAYGEIDPTPAVAVTFVLMFGLMFGDVGHGLVLALAGLAAWKGWMKSLKRFASFAPVLMASGLSAMVFGLLYGSVFGIEHLLPALWLRPLDSITSILLATIVFGVAISVVGFVANIVNGLRAKDWRRAFFDRFGLAGLCFYLGLWGIVLALTQGIQLPMPLLIGVVVIPLILIAAGEPLAKLIAKHHPLIDDSLGLYLVQSFFELFEALISYLSSSLSYVRLGAFAVAHGGLSAVVFILAEMMGGPSSPLYWLVVAGGNLFIIGFEGLIVGIQTLRLEYYEFFSKFFTGGGVPYRPLSLSGEKN